MAPIQSLDVPDHLYRLLVQRARQERRSIARQAVVSLARGLGVKLDPKFRRRALLAGLNHRAPTRLARLTDPAKLVRRDRLR